MYMHHLKCTVWYRILLVFLFYFVSPPGWFVAVDVRPGVDEESGAGENKGGGRGRLHHAHHGVRVLDHLRGHRDCPRYPTGEAGPGGDI